MRRIAEEVAKSRSGYNWWPIYLVLVMNVAVVLGWLLLQPNIPAVPPGEKEEDIWHQ